MKIMDTHYLDMSVRFKLNKFFESHVGYIQQEIKIITIGSVCLVPLLQGLKKGN